MSMLPVGKYMTPVADDRRRSWVVLDLIPIRSNAVNQAPCRLLMLDGLIWVNVE